MKNFIDKTLNWSFYALVGFVPLILYPYTSEIFEFNKMVAVYILTVIIISSWTAKSIITKKIIFRRTIMDIPLVIFFASQLISTFISIDMRTSIYGYYSRFHGGLLSTICYTLLYWAYVSNFNKFKTLKSIKFLIGSAIIVSIYGVLEHFGIDKNIWVQDVQNRIFSTLGQPNWLAAWLVALTPLAWTLTILAKTRSDEANGIPWNYFYYLLASLLFFFTFYPQGCAQH